MPRANLILFTPGPVQIPAIVKETEDPIKQNVTMEITGTAPFQLYGTAAGAPVRATMTVT